MSNLQGAGGVTQGSPDTTRTNNPQAIGAPGLQPNGGDSSTPSDVQQVLGVNSALSGSSGGQVLSVTTSTGSNNTSVQAATTDVSLTPQTQFSVPGWFMIVAGLLVVVAGVSFIWSQRNDMTRNQ